MAIYFDVVFYHSASENEMVQDSSFLDSALNQKFCSLMQMTCNNACLFKNMTKLPVLFSHVSLITDLSPYHSTDVHVVLIT
jgi:hypothetical protein